MCSYWFPLTFKVCCMNWMSTRIISDIAMYFLIHALRLNRSVLNVLQLCFKNISGSFCLVAVVK